jgi:hypothetical protein
MRGEIYLFLVFALIFSPVSASSDTLSHHGEDDGARTLGDGGHEEWPLFRHDLLRTGLSRVTSKEEGTSAGVLWTFKTNGVVRSSASIADINGDGNPEIIIGSFDMGVYCLGGESHDNGFGLIWDFYTGDWVEASAAMADLDNDGELEVVIGSYDGNVYCLDGKGEPKWSFATMDAVTSSPAVADIDHDQELEIIIGSYDGNIYCLDKDGKLKWNYTTRGAVTSSPAVADIDHDQELEIIIGSFDGKVYCLDRDGTLKWSFGTRGAVTSTPAIADVDGDHENEIIIGSYDGNVYCIDGEGNSKWGFATGGAVTSSPAVADMDEDHDLEVVIGSFDKNVYCLDESGIMKWSFATGGAVTSSPAVADMDGDGSPDVVVGSDDNNVYLLELDRDLDGDGLLSSREREMGTDPHNPDTDGDGIPDGNDKFPLDRDNDGVPDAEDFAVSLNNRIIYAVVVLFLIISVSFIYLIYRFVKALHLVEALAAGLKGKGAALAGKFSTMPDDIRYLSEAMSEQPAKVKGILLIGGIVALQVFMGVSYMTYMTIQWDSDFCLLGCHAGNKLMAEAYYAWNESVHGNHVAECHDCHHARPTDNMLLMLEVAKRVTAIHKVAHVPDEKCLHCHVELEEWQTKYVSPLVSPGIKRLSVEDFPLVEKPSETGHGVHVTREHIPCLECHTSGGVHRFKPKENICDKCHYDPLLGPPEEYKESAHGGGHGGGH